MDTGLKGKTVVVTGAAGAIGKEICAGFAANGSNVVGVDIADLRETAAYVESQADRTLWRAYKIDQASIESVREGCRQIRHDFPKVHALINNAALYAGIKKSPMENLDLEEWDLVMKINVRGVYLMIRELLPALKASQGKVVNFASGAALRGGLNMLHYIASKGAVLSMTRALSAELGAYGIKVNTVAPGHIDTPSSQEINENYPSLLRSIVQAQSIQDPMQAKDVVGAVLYLSSSWSDSVTGQVCLVDRGLIKY